MKAIRLEFVLTALAMLAMASCLRVEAAERFRGIWVDAWGSGFINKEQVVELVRHCRTYNFNAVIVQMRRRGDAYYMPQPPNGEPRTREVAGDFDALQELIDQCHAGPQRIEIHCWVPTHVIWSGEKPPAQPEHVFNRHPEFLMQDSTGKKFIGEGYYLDPGHPGATRWNYRMAQDIVSRYDIDGFHWDYIRYPAPDSGYNPTAIERYNYEFGLTGKPSPSDENFSNWRRRQVTDFLRWCNADLLAIKPKLIISCSVFGSRSDAFNARFQDWAAWNEEGLIDLCMPMGYTADKNLFHARVTDAAAHQGIRWVYQGQGAYLCTKEQTVEQLNYTGEKGLRGYVFYSYRVPQKGAGSKADTFALVRNAVQPSWTNAPALPWKVNPTNGILKGVVTRADSGAEVYNATVTIDRVARKQRTEAHGGYAFFEMPPAEYIITATAAGLGSGSVTASVSPGIVTSADIVLSTTDTTPPGIYNLRVDEITDHSALVRWDTDEHSDTRVEYGRTDPSEFSTFRFGQTLKHEVRLQDLLPESDYRIRARASDAARNTKVSNQIGFTTLRKGAVADIVLDDAAARVVGAWTASDTSPEKHGKDYRYKGKGNGSAYVEFRPTILRSGTYSVYEWHVAGQNRATSTPCIIGSGNSTSSTNINQRVAGSQWNLVGVFRFEAGTNTFIRITDGFTDPGKHVAVADAVKLVFIR